ncbi:MAG: QueT transporter family protein [Christensenellaceae bacterium]|nr:QueT transporter family protein [Christensenellaceae bacterium]
MKKTTRSLTHGALIAALYVALTRLAQLLGLASGAIQVRFSEALTVLPYFTAAAVPGLTVGCLLANILTGCALWDVVFGTLATLLGAVLTRSLRQYSHLLAPLPPIAANTLIVPFVLTLVYQFPGGLAYHFATVFLGEVISCGVLGLLLMAALRRVHFSEDL